MGGAEFEPDEGMSNAPEKTAEPLHVLHRDLSTANQIGMLITVLGTTMEYLGTSVRDTENIPGSRPTPGESRLAAETTLIKACSRIDSILDDPSRWGTDYQTALEAMFVENSKATREVAEAHKKALQSDVEKSEAQKRAALEVQSPHFIYRPSLVRDNDGQWIAFLGDLENLDDGVVGLGKDPAAASRAFDLAFTGLLTEEQQATVKLHIRKLNENNTVDPSGSQPTHGAPEGGTQLLGNIGDD